MECSVDGYKPIVRHVVPYRMGERNAPTIIYGRSIDAATLELVNECLVVIGSHTCPAGITDLMIENCY
jgi:hypothetical protein